MNGKNPTCINGNLFVVSSEQIPAEVGIFSVVLTRPLFFKDTVWIRYGYGMDTVWFEHDFL